MSKTSQVGEITRTQVIAALTLQGKRILLPLGDFQRYDLVIDEGGGRFLRVQCKTGRLANGVVSFYPCSVDSRSEEGRCIRKGYAEDVELFGVYCPENGKCYLIPVGDVTENQATLRVDPPRNGQRTRIRWAAIYEMGKEKVELAGFEPATS